MGEYENLDELNYLASKLDELDDHDYNHFQAAMQISDYTGSIKDVINLIDNRMEKWEVYIWLQAKLGLNDQQAHIGMFSDGMCDEVIRLCYKAAAPLGNLHSAA